MGLKLLFVCTGNTCRSPLAEGMARAMFGEAAQVCSAGTNAWDGDAVSPHVVEILRDFDMDLSRHRARRINEELMSDADWIIPMTLAQEDGLKRTFPQFKEKISCLGNWGEEKRDIIDPWMGSIDVYRQTAAEIKELLSSLKNFLDFGSGPEKKA